MVKRKNIKKWYNYGSVVIGFTTYNNKSRKGRYVVVKDVKTGKRGAYKYQEGTNLGDYYKAFKSKLKVKKWGVKPKKKRKTAELYRKKVGRTPSIESIIKKGMTTTKPVNLKTADRHKTTTIYKAMLRELVKDRELLDILTQEENIKKIKHRIESKIIMTDDSGGVVANLTVYNKTAGEVILDIQENLKQGEISSSGVSRLRDKGYRIEMRGEYRTEFRQGFPPIMDVTNVKGVFTFVKGR